MQKLKHAGQRVATNRVLTNAETIDLARLVFRWRLHLIHDD